MSTAASFNNSPSDSLQPYSGSPRLYQYLVIALYARRHPLSSRSIMARFANTAPTLPIGTQLIPNPFTFTTHLTLWSHTPKQCAQYESLVMPQLQVLRVVEQTEGHLLNLCINDDGARYLCASRSASRLSPTCRLISHLRPRQIHLGAVDSGFKGIGAGLYTSKAPFPPAWLYELVIDIGCGTDYGTHACSFLDAIPANIHRLTFVLPSWRMDQRWKVMTGEEACERASHSWVKLAAATTGQAQEMELVGLELVDPTWKGMSAEERREKAKAILVYCWVECSGLKEEDARERAERIKFTAGAEFKERQGAKQLPDGARTITSGGMSIISYDD